MANTRIYTITLKNGDSFDKAMLNTNTTQSSLRLELAQDIADGDFNDTAYEHIEMTDVESIVLKKETAQ